MTINIINISYLLRELIYTLTKNYNNYCQINQKNKTIL